MINMVTVKAALTAAGALVLVATTAQAQTAPSAASAKVADAAAANTEQLSEIVITGSRVIKNGNDSPTPVTVVTVEDTKAVIPGNIADQLNQLPQFAGSRGLSTNPGGGSQGTSSAASNPEANTLNLRNMGYTRTLVLFNGHRVAPTGTDGTVDVDMVPQMLLQRVDIVTGGASAVYGSDAVTGVVNFVTDTKFNGVKAEAQAGISHYKDDRSTHAGIAGGMDLFGGRGHIEGSFETSNSAGVLNRSSDRPFGRNRWTMQQNNTSALGPYFLVGNARNSLSSFGGLIRSGPLANMEFAQNGILIPFDLGTVQYPNTGYHVGGSGSYDDTTLSAPLAQNQAYGRLDFDFTDAVHGYVDVAGTYSHTWAQATFNNLTTPNGSNNGAIKLSSTDPFLPAAIQQQLAAAGPTFDYAKTFTDLPASNVDTWERQYQANLGLNVKLGGGYEWDLFYSHARNLQNTRQNANINTQKLVAALNAVVNPANNQIVCAVSLTANAALYPGCVPMNPFGPTAEDQAAINYVTGVTEFRAYTTMDDATTSVTGAPFSTWAGPVNTALSAEWRRLAYYLNQWGVPNTPSNPLSCAGLPAYDCVQRVSAQTWATQTSAPRSPVSQSVKEGAVEFDAPLLKDVTFAKDLSFNGAARWTDYSTSGVDWTWKGGLVWKVNDQLTLRGTRSKDIRAPTLNDLYVPPSPSTYGGTDFVTGVIAINPAIPFTAQGNANLVPEVGNTVTGGFIYQPRWLPGLSVTVDAYKIDISNALASFRGASGNVMTGCAASGGSSAFCQLIVRPIDCCSTAVANTATALYTESLNVADQWSDGVDLEINYAGRVHEHPFSVRALTTYQPNIVYQVPGNAQYNMAGVAFNNGALQATPVWRVVVLGRYSPVRNFTVDVMERWRSPLQWGPIYAPPNNLIFQNPPIESVWYTNLTLSYLFMHEGGSQTTIFANVTNLFNRQPPAASFFGNQAPGNFGGFAIGDDPIGAYYTVGFRYRL
jgi:iron complex outermembrane receptor protein